MATRRKQKPSQLGLTFELPPPIDEEGWKRLESMPGVIVRRRDPRIRGWTFETDVQAQPGFSVVSLIDQDEIEAPMDRSASTE